MPQQSRPARTDIGDALRSVLISPNESDQNLEPANVVDGLFAIARSISGLTAAVREHATARDRQAEMMQAAVRSISHGDVNGPTGLEMLSMDIVGPGAAGHDSVTSAIRDGFHEIAEVLADAVSK